MSDSTDSEQEIVNPSPVRAHSNSSFAQKTKETRKRDHSSSIDAETRAKQPQNADFYAEKGKLFCKFCSIRKDHSQQSVLSAHCIIDTHKKNKSSEQPKRVRFRVHYLLHYRIRMKLASTI